MKKAYLFIIALFLLNFSLISCDGCAENAERAGQKMEEVGDDIEEAADETTEDIEEAVDDVKEEIHEATEDDGPDTGAIDKR